MDRASNDFAGWDDLAQFWSEIGLANKLAHSMNDQWPKALHARLPTP
jgi:hypothetical protein